MDIDVRALKAAVSDKLDVPALLEVVFRKSAEQVRQQLEAVPEAATLTEGEKNDICQEVIALIIMEYLK